MKQKSISNPLLLPNHVLLSKIKVDDVTSPSNNRMEDLLVARLCVVDIIFLIKRIMCI